MLHSALHRISELSFASWIFAAAMVVLAVEPVVWLVETWFNPVYDSPGLWVFSAVLGLGAWSLTSRVIDGRGAHQFDRFACALLLGTAALRLSGHLIAIHVLAAFSLVLDVWAIGRLLRLHQRERAISPFWLSVLFAFSLPIERIVQRLIGFPLQMISAEGACAVLKAGFSEVVCNGVDLQVAGAEVLVDLPCSGARGLMLLAIAFAALCSVHRPGILQAFVGTGLALVSAYVSNVLRISALSAGVALGPEVLGFDVMMRPWHDIVGWAALALGVAPLILWANAFGQRVAGSFESSTRSDRKDNLRLRGRCPQSGQKGTPPRATVPALIATLAAATLFFSTSEPVDVSRPVETVELPRMMLGQLAQEDELSEHEEAFFTRYGGAARRASYGSSTLLVVRTTSPLRHIHAPDECLRGLGYDVDRLGVRNDRIPHALYRAVDRDGRVWRVSVTYISSNNDIATSVAEAVWMWLRDPSTTWTVYERLQPWGDEAAHHHFEDTVLRFYELPTRR